MKTPEVQSQILKAEDRRRCGTLSGIVGICGNAVLFCLKLFVAILSGGISVLADALNNLSDAGSSVVTLVGFRMAGKPADKEHPFGHGRIEYIAGFIVATLIIVMGVELMISSVKKIIEPTPVVFSTVTMIVLAVGIVLKIGIGIFNLALSKKTDSPVMRTTAKDSFCDVATTSAVLIGVLVSYFADVSLDAYFGAAVSLFVLMTGIFSAKDCLSPLLGQKPGKELIEEIKTTVMAHAEIEGVHDLMVHDYGPGRKIVSLHAEVRSDCNLLRIHDTIDLIERELAEKYECETTIHMDPIDSDDEFTQEMAERISAAAANLGDVTIHDLRTVRGTTHTNFVFDCVVPFGFKYKDNEVRAYLEEALRNMNPTYFAVVHVERDYTQE